MGSLQSKGHTTSRCSSLPCFASLLRFNSKTHRLRSLYEGIGITRSVNSSDSPSNHFEGFTAVIMRVSDGPVAIAVAGRPLDPEAPFSSSVGNIAFKGGWSWSPVSTDTGKPSCCGSSSVSSSPPIPPVPPIPTIGGFSMEIGNFDCTSSGIL